MKRPTDVFWSELSKLDDSMDKLSYYQLLGVDATVDGPALQLAYERQVRVLHPDRHARESDPQRKKTLTRVYARVGEAYRVLSQPSQRSRYDQNLSEGRTRLEERRGEQGPSTPAMDPANAQARSLFDQAQVLIARGELRAAKAKLALAKQYEPGSAAIVEALSACEPSAQPVEPAAAPATVDASAPPDDSADNEFDQRPPSRVHERAPLGQNIKVGCKSWQDVQTFHMHNISRGGMLLRCETLLPLGSVLELTVLTPDREPIELPAEVVRHVPPNKPGQRPGIGIRFIVIPAPVRERFETLLKVAGLGARSEPEATPLSGSVQQAMASACLLIDAAEYSKACQELQEPVREHPDDHHLRSIFHLAAGLLARSRSNQEAAHSHFERALRFDPDSPLVLRILREQDP